MKIKYNARMLEILLKKVKYYDWCNELGGCFAYAEVVLLVDHYGLKEFGDKPWKYRWAVDHLKKGENDTTWVYFHPDKKFMKKYMETVRHG